MSSRRKIAVSVALFVIGGAVAGVAIAQKARQEQTSPPAAHPNQADCVDISGRSARIQVDAFELTCSPDQLADLDLDKLTADVTAPADLLAKLRGIGNTQTLFRADERFMLGEEVLLRSGSRVPVVQNLVANRQGEKTPSISYNDVGYILNVTAHRNDNNPELVVGTCQIEVSNVATGTPEIAPGVSMPSFHEMKMTKCFVAQKEEAVYTMASNISGGSTEGMAVHVLILRIVMSR